jgi:hypothetical protein
MFDWLWELQPENSNRLGISPAEASIIWAHQKEKGPKSGIPRLDAIPNWPVKRDILVDLYEAWNQVLKDRSDAGCGPNQVVKAPGRAVRAR